MGNHFNPGPPGGSTRARGSNVLSLRRSYSHALQAFSPNKQLALAIQAPPTPPPPPPPPVAIISTSKLWLSAGDEHEYIQRSSQPPAFSSPSEIFVLTAGQAPVVFPVSMYNASSAPALHLMRFKSRPQRARQTKTQTPARKGSDAAANSSSISVMSFAQFESMGRTPFWSASASAAAAELMRGVNMNASSSSMPTVCSWFATRPADVWYRRPLGNRSSY